MSDLEVQALKHSIKVCEEYPLLVSAGKPRELLLLFQKCYMEGYSDGLRQGHESTLKVFHDTLGK